MLIENVYAHLFDFVCWWANTEPINNILEFHVRKYWSCVWICKTALQVVRRTPANLKEALESLNGFFLFFKYLFSNEHSTEL